MYDLVEMNTIRFNTLKNISNRAHTIAPDFSGAVLFLQKNKDFCILVGKRFGRNSINNNEHTLTNGPCPEVRSRAAQKAGKGAVRIFPIILLKKLTIPPIRNCIASLNPVVLQSNCANESSPARKEKRP